MAVQNKKNTGSFFKSVKAELKKVSWPNKTELKDYTTVVIVFCGLATMGLWLVDTLFTNLMKVFL